MGKQDRRQLIAAQHIQLYSSAYQLALRRISALQKRQQPYIVLHLHAFIRRQIKAGATDASIIAFEALRAFDQRSWQAS